MNITIQFRNVSDTELQCRKSELVSAYVSLNIHYRPIGIQYIQELYILMNSVIVYLYISCYAYMF
jgi:hypothetical protein